jgi:pilus assembly protein FimV
VINHLRITVSALLALAFAFMAAPAWALGLGQIKVLSQRDQPLLAEIPVISADPSELEALQARLASPDTFARVGLAPPQGIVSDLQFAVALDARGRPVVRVTSAAPVQQPLLTFLLEVDWGHGRLVREYSALLDTPQTAAAPAQPPIQEATVDPVDVVVRPPAVEPENPLVATAPKPVPLPAPKPTPPAPAPTPSNVLQADAPVPVPLPAPSEREVAAAAPIEVVADEQTRTVRPGETLAGIAAEVGRGRNLDQTLVALLRANPEAFIGGNANRLRAGAVLRIPAGSGIDRYSPDEAAVVVREQAAQWRGAGRALPQPPAVVGAAPADAVATPAAPAKPRTPRTAAQARLEIVPAAGNEAKRAGQRSGTSAGGEGDMVRQELQQTKESLAARDAEVQELKARVAELEQLQQKQAQLLAMKDNALASAQQKLAAGQQVAAAKPAAKADNGSLLPWIGAAVGLVLLAVVAVLWLRRRAAEPAVVTALRNDVARDRTSPADTFDADVADTAADDAPVSADEPPAAPPSPADEPPATEPSPAWSRLAPSADPEPPKPAVPTRPVPTWHSGGVDVGPLNPAPPGQGRLDLARAYLDMGDRDTARSLLQEVAARGDTLGVRMEAEKLLRELG